MSIFVSIREKRRVCEKMDDILRPIMRYVDEETREELKTGLQVIREADVEEGADIEKWNVIADKIQGLLIEVGQHDYKKFHLGETIKYDPVEVADIIRDNALKLEE